MTFYPHKHKASDIVETKDDYLLPYLRSLRDPSKIERTMIEGSEPLPEGTAFPTEPYEEQFFRLTTDITGYPAALYRYDGAADDWTRLQSTRFENATEPSGIDFILGDTWLNTTNGMHYKWTGTAWLRTTTMHTEGTTLPSSDMIDGDTFYNTTEKKTYFYDGSNWLARATPSHDGLTDVGASDHHAVFTSTTHANVEHLAAMLNQALQPYNSNITFARKSGFEHNAITYTAGEVKFQDGTARTITPAGELTSIPVGDNYIYFRTDSASLFQTTSHVDAISSGRGLLAIIIVASTTDPDIPCAIQPFYAKGLNLTADTMAVTLLSAISAYLGTVEIAGGRIILGDTGIIGTDVAETVMFYISTDGKAYFAEGAIRLDDVGLNIISDSSTQYIVFRKANETIKGAIYKDVNDYIVIHSTDGRIRMRGHTVPLADLGFGLGISGATPIRWKYYVPSTVLAQRPAASIDTLGLLWQTRETGSAKTKTWQCVQNYAGGYEWIQTGIST